MIQTDQVISLTLKQFQTFFTAGRHIHLQSGLFEQSLSHCQIHGIVIHNQDSSERCDKLLIIIFTAPETLIILLLKVPQRLRIYHLLYHLKRKRGTFSIGAVHFQPAAHHLNKPVGDRKPKPRPLFLAPHCGIHPLKYTEKFFHILFFNTDSGIKHGQIQFNLILRHLFPGKTQRHLAFLCKFDGIG